MNANYQEFFGEDYGAVKRAITKFCLKRSYRTESMLADEDLWQVAALEWWRLREKTQSRHKRQRAAFLKQSVGWAILRELGNFGYNRTERGKTYSYALSHEELVSTPDMPEGSHDEGPYQEVVALELMREMQFVLSRTSPKQAQMWERVYVAGESQAAVAQSYGLLPTSISGQMAAITQRMKKAWSV